eukprot:SAG31_NODE_3052_length_4740_cov_1.733894_2_plen_237_part_00
MRSPVYSVDSKFSTVDLVAVSRAFMSLRTKFITTIKKAAWRAIHFDALPAMSHDHGVLNLVLVGLGKNLKGAGPRLVKRRGDPVRESCERAAGRHSESCERAAGRHSAVQLNGQGYRRALPACPTEGSRTDTDTNAAPRRWAWTSRSCWALVAETSGAGRVPQAALCRRAGYLRTSSGDRRILAPRVVEQEPPDERNRQRYRRRSFEPSHGYATPATNSDHEQQVPWFASIFRRQL